MKVWATADPARAVAQPVSRTSRSKAAAGRRGRRPTRALPRDLRRLVRRRVALDSRAGRAGSRSRRHRAGGLPGRSPPARRRSTAATWRAGSIASPVARSATSGAAPGSSTSSPGAARTSPTTCRTAGVGPAAALERKEEQRVLHTLLMKMAEARRTAFVLFEIEGLSGDEIARIQEHSAQHGLDAAAPRAAGVLRARREVSEGQRVEAKGGQVERTRDERTRRRSARTRGCRRAAAPARGAGPVWIRPVDVMGAGVVATAPSPIGRPPDASSASSCGSGTRGGGARRWCCAAPWGPACCWAAPPSSARRWGGGLTG